MEIKDFMKRISQIEGVSEVREYTLINNYGVAFKKYGYKFDIRFWANCYGVCLNYWSIMVEKKFYDDGKKLPDGDIYVDDISEYINVIARI